MVGLKYQKTEKQTSKTLKYPILKLDKQGDWNHWMQWTASIMNLFEFQSKWQKIKKSVLFYIAHLSVQIKHAYLILPMNDISKAICNSS